MSHKYIIFIFKECDCNLRNLQSIYNLLDTTNANILANILFLFSTMGIIFGIYSIAKLHFFIFSEFTICKLQIYSISIIFGSKYHLNSTWLRLCLACNVHLRLIGIAWCNATHYNYNLRPRHDKIAICSLFPHCTLTPLCHCYWCHCCISSINENAVQ